MSEIAVVETTTDMLPAPQKMDVSGFVYEQFLPRIELKTGAQKVVKAGKIPQNHWAIIPAKDKLIDLGEEVLVYPLAFRAMAIDFSNKEKVRTSFNPQSPEFKDMERRADAPRAANTMAPCGYGLQFLLFVKDHGYVTYFAGSNSAKAMAPSLIALVYKYTKLTSFFRETASYSWQAPDAALSNATFDLPPVAELTAQINKFVKAPTEVFETAPDQEGDVEVVAGTDRPQ